MASLLAKPLRLITSGARCLAAAGLIALLAPAARANGATAGCVLELETQNGLITIDSRDGSDGDVRLDLKFETEADLVGTDGSTARFAFFGTTQSPLARDAIPALLDNLAVTLQFGDVRQIDAPALIYYTRDNTIPFDIAPAKLWYPGYNSDTDRLEIAVTLGDLERHMAWGPGEAPATVLSWIAKRVGTGYHDDDVVGSGDIPLAPIRDARAAMGAALEQVVAAQQSGGC